jgi:nucleoside-diphosphate-sugar epimerase
MCYCALPSLRIQSACRIHLAQGLLDDSECLAAPPSRSTLLLVLTCLPAERFASTIACVERVAFAVLGARGFIGARTVAWLRGRALSVRAVARDLGGLERDPDAKVADALDVPALASAFHGCDVVVNAVFPDAKTAGRAMEALYAASEAAGVRRIVHISTAVVSGQAPPPSTDERSPLSLWQEFAYNNSKVRAERALRRARARGAVEIVMLRPGIVFGPRSQWIAEFAEALLGGRAALIDGGRGICNSIYVDNLAHAIELAARVPDADDEAFLVGDAERVTWADLYGPIAKALGYDLSSVPNVEPPRHAARWSDRLRDVARNSERLEPVRRTMAPATRALRSLLRRGRPSAGAPPAHGGAPFLDAMHARLQQCSVRLPINKAERLLGYEPPVSFEEGVQRSIAWMQTAGYPVRSAQAPLRPSGPT